MAATHDRAISVEPYALLGLASALWQTDLAQDIARLAAPAVSSAVSVPFAAVLLASGRSVEERVFARRDGREVEADLARELDNALLSPGKGYRSRGPSTNEIIVEESVLPHCSRSGLHRLLVSPLTTVERNLGAVVAGSESTEPFQPHEQAILELLAVLTSSALNRAALHRRLVRRTTELSFLHTLAATVSRRVDSGNLVRVLGVALEQTLELTGMEAGAVFELQPEPASLRLRVERNLPDEAKARLERAPLPLGEALPGIAAQRCELLIVDRANEDERELPPLRDWGSETHISIPLAVHGRALGVLTMIDRRSHVFDASTTALLTAAGEQLGIAIERSKLVDESRERAKLEERGRLAREIHDTLTQSLTGIAIQLEAAEEALSEDAEAARAEIRSARALAREGLGEARRSIWDLQPLALGSGSLRQAIEAEVANSEKDGIRTSLAIEGAEPESLDARCELSVFRIVQEALSNVRRHAQATRVGVRLAYGPTEVLLEVSDDGVGFDPSVGRGPLPPSGSGFGLTSMHERARLAGGELAVRSSPGVGTRIEARIPYEQARDEAPSVPRPSTASGPASAAPEGPIRILIVDDHEVVRQGIRRMLERVVDFLVVGEAADGEGAIDQVQALSPDVVLLDLELPRLNGVQTLARLRELGVDTQVILLSTYAKDEYIVEGLRGGARGYLLKDTSREDLVHAIRTIHRGGSLLQPVVAGRLLERLETRAASDLTERELDVLRLLATGARSKEIAAQLSVSVRTVRFHTENIFRKLGATTRTQAVRIATERGLLST